MMMIYVFTNLTDLVWDGHGTLLLGHTIDWTTVSHYRSLLSLHHSEVALALQNLTALVAGGLGCYVAHVLHLDLVKDQLMFTVTQVLDLHSTIACIHWLSIDEEVDWCCGILHLDIEDDLFSFNTLLEVTHSLLEGIVV